MKILICDDEKIIHDEIQKNLSAFSNDIADTAITNCYSGEEAMTLIDSSDVFDIVFLDIEMGATNGIEVAEKIRETQPDTIIIFVSSHKNYVFDAFRCEALHYIVKPIERTEFEDVFNRTLHKYRLLNNFFPVKWNHSRSNLKIDDILYIEGFKRRLIVHTEDKTYEHIGKLSDAYEELCPHGFVYVHQGFIVNMHYIRSFYADKVELQNGQTVMVSVRKRADALKTYDKYLQKWKW